MTPALVADLAAGASELSARVIENMYEDPFWLARFGERGRKFAEEDGRRHLTYLEQALIAGDPSALVEYARWLRPVLTSRGMCTLHLDENFERLARAIEAQVADAEPALAYLERAREGLRYTSGAEGELEAVKARLIDAAVEEVAGGGASRARLAREIAHVLSYLRDAAALARPELFVEYAAFASDLARRGGRAHADFSRTLAAIGGLLATDPGLSQATRGFARDALERALARIEAVQASADALNGDLA